jgi:endonuclease-3
MLLDKKAINAIFDTWAQENPAPKTELYSTNDFTLLVAIILSAQATDAGVNKATPALFEIADTPQKMLKLGETGLKQYIKTIGLFNSKAKNIILMSKTLIHEYGGKIPEDGALLQTLAGVGRKTANVWLNCARGVPTIAVDTHVFRVSNRIGLCNTKNPLQTELALLKRIPSRWLMHAHHWLILHGRYICIARKPKCNICSVREWCTYTAKESA